ncbi:hypothetical protein TELCIR_08928 [Teladorsagia circumcincta]|uniref:CUB domain-containing protein n=1 Tax=Teladorsagia circumcincta TaxID=45464 RepID=A0A2G9UG86_TELCI|nr:hypothetical protein TELCIR_08928 [Teladorsagia circumcincta]
MVDSLIHPPGCGKVLKARANWRTLEDNLTDSNTGPDGFNKCTYWIRAPKGERVEVRIAELPVGYANDGCVDAGVEIKTHRDKRRTGYRFCSSAYLDMTLISHSHMVPVIIYSREGLNQTKLSEDYYVDEGEPEDESEDIDFVGDSDEDEDEEEEEELFSTSTKLLYRIFPASK